MRIPISAAKKVAEEQNCRQVILLAWDGELTHIVTYGKSIDDCAQAAAGGNILKQKWGWPECNDQPSRVKKLEQELAERESAWQSEREQWKALPDEQAWWWHWNGEDYAIPHIYSVMVSKSGGEDRYFIAFPDSRWCDEVGGFWVKIKYPNVPTREEQRTLASGPQPIPERKAE